MAYPSDSDRDTIDKVLTGDRRAYGVLVDRYKDRALTLAVRLVGDRHDAEEIVQDAFVRAYKGLAGFRGDAVFATWFYRILHNLCMTKLARRRESPRYLSGEEEEGLDTLLVDADEPTILDRLEDEELRDIMMQEIASLPDKFKSVILLFYIEGFAYDEIVHVLQIPLGSVKTNLFRGRNLLRERIIQRMGNEVRLA